MRATYILKMESDSCRSKRGGGNQVHEKRDTTENVTDEGGC